MSLNSKHCAYCEGEHVSSLTNFVYLECKLVIMCTMRPSMLIQPDRGKLRNGFFVSYSCRSWHNLYATSYQSTLMTIWSIAHVQDATLIPNLWRLTIVCDSCRMFCVGGPGRTSIADQTIYALQVLAPAMHCVGSQSCQKKRCMRSHMMREMSKVQTPCSDLVLYSFY